MYKVCQSLQRNRHLCTPAKHDFNRLSDSFILRALHLVNLFVVVGDRAFRMGIIVSQWWRFPTYVILIMGFQAVFHPSHHIRSRKPRQHRLDRRLFTSPLIICHLHLKTNSKDLPHFVGRQRTCALCQDGKYARLVKSTQVHYL